MSVELDPANQLAFARPFTQLVKEILVVRNRNHEPVAFKVKTTAPKQYCVRPNSGRIEGGQSVEVQVILQPMKEDPPPDFKCKDKFLVQSVTITPERDTMSLQDLWTMVEREAKGDIMENKIRCVYLPPANQTLHPVSPPPTSPPPPVPNTTTTNNALAYNSTVERKQSPVSDYDTSANRAVYQTVKESPLAPINDQSPPSQVDRGFRGNGPNGYANHQQTRDMSGTFPTDPEDRKLPQHADHDLSNKNTISDDDPARLRRQLLDAEEEIKRLKRAIESYKHSESVELRQRKTEASKTETPNATPEVGIAVASGTSEVLYPFEVVVGAAVGAFLFGVIFF